MATNQYKDENNKQKLHFLQVQKAEGLEGIIVISLLTTSTADGEEVMSLVLRNFWPPVVLVRNDELHLFPVTI